MFKVSLENQELTNLYNQVEEWNERVDKKCKIFFDEDNNYI